MIKKEYINQWQHKASGEWKDMLVFDDLKEAKDDRKFSQLSNPSYQMRTIIRTSTINEEICDF
jgi:hypothetical protein